MRRWMGLCLLILGLAAVRAPAKTVHVQVGPNKALIFSPATVTINVGDTVQWDWAGNNHTVTSGSCCSFNGLFNLGDKGTSPPSGQGVGFSASHTFTQPGSFPYFCKIHGSNFGMTGNVTVLTPDYSINLANSTVGPVFPGQMGTFRGTLLSQGGYNNSVALSCQPLAPAAQPNCAVDPTSAVPSAAGTPFTVTNLLDAGIPPMDLQFQLHGAGSDGTNHNSQVLTLKVVNFDFSGVGDLTVGPTGNSATETFLASGFNGFTGAVTFACGELPANAQCVFGVSASSNCDTFAAGNAVQLGPNHEAVCMSLKVTTANTPGGVYAVNVIAGTPGAPDFSRMIQLTVPDYTLPVANPLIAVFPGGGGTFNATLTSLGGLSGNVTITCGTADATVQCSPSSSPIALASTPQDFSVTFTTTAGTQPQDYVANIQGSDGNGLDHAIAVTIRVVDIALGAPSSSTIDAVQGNPAAPVALAVSALGNWSPTITLACSGAAITAGASCSFSPGATLSPGPNGTVNASLVILSGTAPQGQSTVTVTATGAFGSPKTAHVQATFINGQPVFKDVQSGQIGVTTIHTGDTVEWDWVGDIYNFIYHSTTSGTCDPGAQTCAFGGLWDSGLYFAPHLYPVTFDNVGSFPYYCRDHGPLYNMVGIVSVAAGSTSKTQDITLNIGAGTGSADLNAVVTSSPSPAAPVGSTVTFTATVSNLSGTTPVAATSNVIFSGSVSIKQGDLPASCVLDTVMSNAVKCNFSSANGTSVPLAIPVTVGFGRSVTAQTFVSSDAADSDPTNNQATATVQVRPRPFSRNGLPVIIP